MLSETGVPLPHTRHDVRDRGVEARPRRGARPSARHARAHAGRAVSSPRGRRPRRPRATVRGSAALDRARRPRCTTRVARRRPGPPPPPSTVGDRPHRPPVGAVAAVTRHPCGSRTPCPNAAPAPWTLRRGGHERPQGRAPRRPPATPRQAPPGRGDTRRDPTPGGRPAGAGGDRDPRAAGAAQRASPRAVRSGRHVARPPWSPPDPVRSGVWGGRCDRGGGRVCAHPRGPRRRRARPARRGGCRRGARARRGRRLRRPRRGAGRPVAPGATGSARPRRVPRWPRRCSARPSARFSTPRRASRRWWTRRAR